MSISNPQGIAKKTALFFQRIYKTVHRKIAQLTGFSKRPMTCEIFHVIEHPGGVSVKGRVMRIRKWRKPKASDHPLRNFWQMMKRWATPERPNTLVKIRMGDVCCEAISDGEGYFDTTVPTLETEALEKKSVTFEIPISDDSTVVNRKPISESAESRCVIISDIDDTVLITHAARTLTMIATTLFGNELTRRIFPGTSALYHGLREGNTPGIDERNPISYVTSSPYNLHGLVSLIFKSNKIPLGAFFMTDWGLDEEKWFKHGHGKHKLASIRQVLSWYETRPAVLIGDSGQRDSAIYSQIVKENPDKIAHVLIRCVSDRKRIKQLEHDWLSVDPTKTKVTFFKDSADAARQLREAGWINEVTLAHVIKAVQTDEP